MAHFVYVNLSIPVNNETEWNTLKDKIVEELTSKKDVWDWEIVSVLEIEDSNKWNSFLEKYNNTNWGDWYWVDSIDNQNGILNLMLSCKYHFSITPLLEIYELSDKKPLQGSYQSEDMVSWNFSIENDRIVIKEIDSKYCEFDDNENPKYTTEIDIWIYD